jgi:PDZ domain/Aspartyl protease
MKSLRLAGSLLFFALAWPSANGQDTGKDAPAVLARFKVARGGDILLLPVAFNGKTYQFVLDTGANAIVFDNSLPLGEAKRKGTGESAGGDLDLHFFKAPDAGLGPWKIDAPDDVVGYDFKKMREVFGLEIYGVLGMDFLCKHIVQMDCDEGEVRFLRRVAGDAGKPIRLEINDGIVFADLEVQGHGKTRFMLDTGMVGPDSGCLDASLLADLTKKEVFCTVGESLSETAAGTKASKLARGKQISVGDFTIDGPVFSEGSRNVLGFGALSRFVVTFDFPNGVMYLKKGKRFAEPDMWNISGLHVLRRQGQTVVHSVDKGSPAATRGIQANDKIAKVDGRPAQDVSMYELFRLCCASETTLDLVIERNGRAYSAKVDLKKPADPVAPR